MTLKGVDEMKNIILTPGTMGLAGLAIDLFGVKRVIPSGWGTPVRVVGLSDDELKFAKEYFEEFFPEYGVSIQEVDENGTPL